MNEVIMTAQEFAKKFPTKVRREILPYIEAINKTLAKGRLTVNIIAGSKLQKEHIDEIKTLCYRAGWELEYTFLTTDAPPQHQFSLKEMPRYRIT